MNRTARLCVTVLFSGSVGLTATYLGHHQGVQAAIYHRYVPKKFWGTWYNYRNLDKLSPDKAPNAMSIKIAKRGYADRLIFTGQYFDEYSGTYYRALGHNAYEFKSTYYPDDTKNVKQKFKYYSSKKIKVGNTYYYNTTILNRKVLK